jgi:hypothetical protein
MKSHSKGEKPTVSAAERRKKRSQIIFRQMRERQVWIHGVNDAWLNQRSVFGSLDSRVYRQG